MFMQIYDFINTTKELKHKQKFVSLAKYYSEINYTISTLDILNTGCLVTSGTYFDDRFCTWTIKRSSYTPFDLLFELRVLTNYICIPSQKMLKIPFLHSKTSPATFYPLTVLPFLFLQVSFWFSGSLARFSREVFRRCQRANYSNVKFAIAHKRSQIRHAFIRTLFVVFTCPMLHGSILCIFGNYVHSTWFHISTK